MILFLIVSIINEGNYFQNKLMCPLSIKATVVAVKVYFMKID